MLDRLYAMLAVIAVLGTVLFSAYRHVSGIRAAAIGRRARGVA